MAITKYDEWLSRASNTDSLIGSVIDKFFNYGAAKQSQELQKKSYELGERSYYHGIEDSAQQYRAVGINPAAVLSGNSSYSTSFSGASTQSNGSGMDSSLLAALLQSETSKEVAKTQADSARDVAEINANASKYGTDVSHEDKLRELGLSNEHFYKQLEIAQREADDKHSISEATLLQMAKAMDKTDAEIRQIESNIKKIDQDTECAALKYSVDEMEKNDKEKFYALCEECGYSATMVDSILKSRGTIGQTTGGIVVGELVAVCAGKKIVESQFVQSEIDKYKRYQRENQRAVNELPDWINH